MSNLPSPRAKRYYWKIYSSLINIYLIKVLNYDLFFILLIKKILKIKICRYYTKNILLKLKRVELSDSKIDWYDHAILLTLAWFYVCRY